MNPIEVAVSAEIPAKPEAVYAVLADYREGHPAILPPQYFKGVRVIEGGTGAGTRVEIQMEVFGAARVFNLVVTEPDPGLVLIETDEAAGVQTSFTIEPLDGGEKSRVTIHTSARTGQGLLGVLEKALNPFIFRRIFRAELERLADYMRENRET